MISQAEIKGLPATPLWVPPKVWKIDVPPAVTDRQEQEVAGLLKLELTELGLYTSVEKGSCYPRGEPLYFRLWRISILDRAGTNPRILVQFNVVQSNDRHTAAPHEAETALFMCSGTFNGEYLPPIFVGAFTEAKCRLLALAQMLGRFNKPEPGVHPY